jgi:GNAT superfamily N-acetyltransferase
VTGVIAAGSEVSYTVTWLEMTRRPETPWPHAPAGPPATLLRAEPAPPWFFLALYDAVGRAYAWEDMHEEPEDDLAEWLADPQVSLYSLIRRGWPHGFFVLDATEPGICNLAYFGLAPQAVGTGLGRFLLGTAVHVAWDLPGVRKLTVNTCTLDHPRALGLYQKAGFAPVRREERRRILTRPIPEPPCSPI